MQYTLQQQLQKAKDSDLKTSRHHTVESLLLSQQKKTSFGQFFTPKEVANFMLDLSKTQNKTTVLEPCSGEGVFLECLIERGFKDIDAFEIDKTIVKKEHEKIVQTKDFIKTPIQKEYGLVIGNPPYVRWKHLSEESREYLKKSPLWTRRINALSDLLQPFIYKSVDLLKPGGELIFITPFFWFQSLHAKKLRGFLAENGHFTEIIHFGEHKLFSDAATNNIIFRYVKFPSKKEKIRILELNGKRNPINQNIAQVKKALKELEKKEFYKNEAVNAFKYDQFVDGETWDILDTNDRKRIEKIEQNSQVKLSDICHIKVGLVSGFDNAFKIDEKTIEKFSSSERDKVILTLKGNDMEMFYAKKFTPYICVDDVKNETDLKEKYPNIYNHLISHKKKLLSRYDYGGKVQWFQHAFPRNKEYFQQHGNKPKIFVPSKDRHPKSRFCYTDEFVFGTQDSVCISYKRPVKENLLYILALLNSEPLNFWYKWRGIRRGDVRQYSFEPMKKIPIKLIDWNNTSEVEKYNKIINLTKDGIVHNEKIEELESKLSVIIDELYG